MSNHKGNLKHGMEKTSEYRAWKSMKARCKYPSGASAKNYVLKGIRVCERWEKFENFIADMGMKPSPQHSLDRIDNSKGYEKDNCRWATRLEQNNNQRHTRILEFSGQRMSVARWAHALGIPAATIYDRLNTQKLSVEEALRK